MKKFCLKWKYLTKVSLSIMVIFVSFKASSSSFIRAEGSGTANDKSSHIHACRAAEIKAWTNSDNTCYRKSGKPVESKILNSTYGFINCDCDHEAQGYFCEATAWVSCQVN